MPRALTLILVYLALLAGQALAEETLASGTAGSIRWEVTSPLSFMPSMGFVPVTVSASNTGTQAIRASYDFRTRDDYYGGKSTNVASGSLDVPAKKTASSTHWIWRGSRAHVSYMRSYINFLIKTGNGSSESTLRGGEREGGLAAGFSRSLVNSISGLDRRGDGNYSYDARTVAGFDPKSLPADWRVFSSLHKIYIGPADWDDLSPGVRDALRTWIGFGGSVRVIDGGTDGERVVEELLPNLAAIGVFASEDPAKAIPPGGLSGDYTESAWTAFAVRVPHPEAIDMSRRARYRRSFEGYDDDSPGRGGTFPLRDAFGRRGIPYLVICMLLIVFAVLVGPVSLRLWAGPGRRHRLFFTTPLFSLVTSGLLLLVMLFQDGLGIDGRRFTLLDLAPADSSQPTAIVYQEQFTRAGMITGGGFALDAGLMPMISEAANDDALSVRDGRAVGGWFSSRRDRSLALAGATPVRWQVTHEGASDEALRLRVECPITKFEAAWFVDGEGAVWKWNQIDPDADGELVFDKKAGMDPSGIMDLMEPKLLNRCSGGLRNLIKARMDQKNQRNRFWALVKDGSAGAVPTGPKIDWRESQLVLTSKVTPAVSLP